MASASHTTDNELIERLKAGDGSAYRQLIALHHHKMLQVARGIAGPAIADEIVANAWCAGDRRTDRETARSPGELQPLPSG
jgi:RNA polymerase sigma-70 factor (ECF subfamily)